MDALLRNKCQCYGVNSDINCTIFYAKIFVTNVTTNTAPDNCWQRGSLTRAAPHSNGWV